MNRIKQLFNTKISLIVHPSKCRIFLSGFLRIPLIHKWAGYIRFLDLRRKHQKQNRPEYCLERLRHLVYTLFCSGGLMVEQSRA